MESATKSIVASALYLGCSVGMFLVNKSLAPRYVNVVILFYIVFICFVLSCLHIIYSHVLTYMNCLPLPLIPIYYLQFY